MWIQKIEIYIIFFTSDPLYLNFYPAAPELCSSSIWINFPLKSSMMAVILCRKFVFLNLENTDVELSFSFLLLLLLLQNTIFSVFMLSADSLCWLNFAALSLSSLVDYLFLYPLSFYSKSFIFFVKVLFFFNLFISACSVFVFVFPLSLTINHFF